MAIAVALVSMLAACTSSEPPVSPTANPSADAASLGAAITSLPRSSSQSAPLRLARGLVPPTNRWFSGLVFGTTAEPVYPTPLSFTPQATGFAIGLPRVHTAADTIFGSAVPDLGVDLGDSTMSVVRYDQVSVTVRYGSAADVTIAEGWPYVAVRARSPLRATLSSPMVPSGTAGVWTTTVSGTEYAIRAPARAVTGARLRLAEGQRAVLFASPSGVGLERMAGGSSSVVTGVAVSAKVGTTTVDTVLHYRTTGGRPLLAALPGQRSAGCGGAVVLNILGELRLCRSGTLTSRVPRRRPSAMLRGLAALSTGDTDTLRRMLAVDIAATPVEPADSYGGGKWLYRLANLLEVARGIGDKVAATSIGTRLVSSLDEWTQLHGCATRSTHCFVYDPTIRGVVGRSPSFGSEQFNDHHFHYGYFLYAAAVAVSYRSSVKERIAPMIDALAADIASPITTDRVPELRVFDPYAGHSWAAGYAPFADGNDEESSSEAVNAWNGLALWAEAVGDRTLAREGVWLLSSEAASARRDWLYPNLSQFPRFEHRFVSLNWGGKRDSTTWFSTDPAAELAIQLIPMSPASTYVATTEAMMRANLSAASRGTAFPDYLAMYGRLAGEPKSRALARVADLPSESIDSADSRTYAAAFVLTH